MKSPSRIQPTQTDNGTRRGNVETMLHQKDRKETLSHRTLAGITRDCAVCRMRKAALPFSQVVSAKLYEHISEHS